MRKIQPDSIEALIFFVLYICAQDKDISDEEMTSSINSAINIELNNFDLFRSHSSSEIKEFVKTNSRYILNKDDFLNKNISKKEKEAISGLFSDPNVINLALLVSRVAATEDGFHKKESHKFHKWSDYWAKA